MAGHIIASFLEDFADIKVSHALSLSEKYPSPLKQQQTSTSSTARAVWDCPAVLNTYSLEAVQDGSTRRDHFDSSSLKSNTVLHYGSLVSISVWEDSFKSLP